MKRKGARVILIFGLTLYAFTDVILHLSLDAQLV